MKKYRVITPDTLVKLGHCFSGEEESQNFFGQMDGLVQELFFSAQMRSKISNEEGVVVLLKQACMFTIFCREHMDLIHQLIANLDCKEISEEEAKNSIM